MTRRPALLPAWIALPLLLAPAWAGAGSEPVAEPVQVWLTTSAGGHLESRLAAQADLRFAAPSATTPALDVDSGKTFQTIDGFGAAMTDSAAWLIFNSPQRDAIMRDLFSPAGNALNLVRVPMGASDLARSAYSYDDTCCDLADFSVAHDAAYLIPLLQQARQLSPALKIFATPWSAPGWMKIGGTLAGDCQGSANYLKNSLYPTYASYFVKFALAYQGTYGLPIYLVSMQNEPRNCSATYPTMNMQPADQSNFALALRGALDDAGLARVKILAWDHNWYEGTVPTTYPQAVLGFDGGQASGAIEAVGYHCYASPMPAAPSVQTTFHDAYPAKAIYLTECTGGSWATNAASNFVWELQNLLILPSRNWSRGSLYFSAALDQDGNPHSGGCAGCRGLVTVNADGGYSRNEDYYAWGHFSRFVAPGAVRVDSTDLGPASLETAAFENPDGSIVLIALNAGSAAQAFQVRWAGQAFSYALPALGAATFKWSPAATLADAGPRGDAGDGSEPGAQPGCGCSGGQPAALLFPAILLCGVQRRRRPGAPGC